MAELLAPAGTLEKLKWAVQYGADAVYFGTKEFSLRSFAGNFSREDVENGMRYLHERGKRGYATLNIYPFSHEYGRLIQTAHALEEAGVDALIVADLGVLSELKKAGVKTALHISTQANTMSSQTVMALKEIGAQRVNLARELSFGQIRTIQEDLTGTEIETEVFIHGAVCFSYSGRCAISDYLTGRRANRGECTHPCRWKYFLVEEDRPGNYMPVAEDSRGLYLFNSRELALFPYVKSLNKTGIASFKIEGRMKSIHYIASIVSLYRRILDGAEIPEQEAIELLSRVHNRGYSYGFIKGGIEPDDYAREESRSSAGAVFLGNITEEKRDSFSLLEVRNTVCAGEEVEVLDPSGKIGKTVLPNPLVTREGTVAERINHGGYALLSGRFKPYSIFRRIKK